MENMIEALVEPVWKRWYTLEAINKRHLLYKLFVGASLLTVSNLKKRIQGIKYVNEAIKNVRQAY